jgi:Ca2+-binding RTX toxin-like protein
MADITGTDGPETLDGTDDADTINGLGGNDTLNGWAGDDILNGGTGVDTVFGGDGDDTIVMADPPQIGFGPGGLIFESIDGGAGFDTLELRPFDDPALIFNGGSGYGLASTTITRVEHIHFASTALVNVTAFINVAQLTSSGITQVTGGAGRDSLFTFVNTAGTYTVTPLTLIGWTNSSTPHLTGDMVGLGANGPGDYTLNAREGLASAQTLTGNVGNDTLNGSSGSEMLNGGGGINLLYGNGGDDLLAIANFNDLSGVPTAYTGAGSTFDGGSGFDLLSIGGLVDFQGTLTGIEGIYLQPAFDSPAPNNGLDQPEAHLIITDALLDTLPGGLELQGTGTITVAMVRHDVFDGSSFVHAAGSAVALVVNGTRWGDSITGSSGDDTLNGERGNDALTGGAGADVLRGGQGTDTLTGGGGADELTGNQGADTFRYDNVSDSSVGAADHIIDFTRGPDTIDLSGIDADTDTAGDQAFGWIGGAAFSGAAGELRAESIGGIWQVSGDTDGDGGADFLILVTTASLLTGADFIA